MAEITVNLYGGTASVLRKTLRFWESEYFLADVFGRNYKGGLNSRYVTLITAPPKRRYFGKFFGSFVENNRVACSIDLYYEVKNMKSVGWRILVFGEDGFSRIVDLSHGLSKEFNVNISIELNCKENIYQSDIVKLQKFIM